MEVEGGAIVDLGFDLRSDRAQLVLAHLGPSASDAGDPLALDIARRLVTSYCRAHSPSGPSYLSESSDSTRRRIAWFDCRTRAVSPSVILLGKGAREPQLSLEEADQEGIPGNGG
jgi:hypothetical protein